MKKILTVLILLLVIVLSGCVIEPEYNAKQVCNELGGVYGNDRCSLVIDINKDGYTQEEVDELISEVYQLLTEQYVMYDKENNVLISDCYIEDSVKQCDFILELDEE